MIQQYIALFIALFFLGRLVWQRKKENIETKEFVLWFLFWVVVVVFVLFIKKFDQLVASLGFSAAGIDVLLYFSMVVLFYLVFRLRLQQERQEREITKITRDVTINNYKKNEK